MSWFGGSGMTNGDPLVFDELETPTNAREYERVRKEALKEVTELYASKQWHRLSFRDPEVGLYELSLPNSALKIIKVTADMPASVKEMWDFLCNDDVPHRQQWEPELKEIRRVEDLSSSMDVVFQAYAAPYPITSRSFVALRAKKKLEDGTLLSYGISINHSDCPYNSSYVRGTVSSAVYIHPKPGNPYMCTVSRVVKLDPKGSIPKWAVNWGINKAGEGVVVLRDVVLKTSIEWDRSGPPAEISGFGEPEEAEKETKQEDEEELEGDEQEVTAEVQKRSKRQESPERDEEGLEFWESSSFLDVEAMEHLVKPLQASFRAVEQSTASSAERMQTILESIEDQQRSLAKAVGKLNSNQQRLITRAAPSSLFGNLSVGAVVFLAAWPVVVVTAYDAYKKYSSKRI